MAFVSAKKGTVPRETEIRVITRLSFACPLREDHAGNYKKIIKIKLTSVASLEEEKNLNTAIAMINMASVSAQKRKRPPENARKKSN